MEGQELIKYEVKQRVDEIRDGIDKNVMMQIKQAMLKNQEFLRTASIEANNRMINDDKVMNSAQLTKKLLELDSKVTTMQYHSDPYVLSDKVNKLHQRMENMVNEINALSNRMTRNEDSLVDAEIKAEDVKKLYVLSGCTHVEMSKYLNVDKSRFYQILNGYEKKPDLRRLNLMKRYFENKINATS
jgi:metal-dependent hydrolase (beta-lactamase superfamily II)